MSVKKAGTPYKRKEGWEQFLTNKIDMLNNYRLSKKKQGGKSVKVEHGNVAESEFRSFLEGFLPAKCGIASGYIISQGNLNNDKITHFDTIIYDKMNCPILWTDNNKDKSFQGKSRAIPAEYIYGVLEIKSKLNTKNVKDGLKKLDELKPFLEGEDPSDERYKKFLPKNFFSGLIFFEVEKSEEYKSAILEKLIYFARGYYGAIILSAEGRNEYDTGIIHLGVSATPTKRPKDRVGQSIITGSGISNSIKVNGEHYLSTLSWFDINFSKFAFDFLAHINGTFDPRRISSFHGLGVGTGPLNP